MVGETDRSRAGSEDGPTTRGLPEHQQLNRQTDKLADSQIREEKQDKLDNAQADMPTKFLISRESRRCMSIGLWFIKRSLKSNRERADGLLYRCIVHTASGVDRPSLHGIACVHQIDVTRLRRICAIDR